MTPSEYKAAKREVEGKNAVGGCLLGLIIFGLFPASLVVFGFMYGCIIAGAATVAMLCGMNKWLA